MFIFMFIFIFIMLFMFEGLFPTPMPPTKSFIPDPPRFDDDDVDECEGGGACIMGLNGKEGSTGPPIRC